MTPSPVVQTTDDGRISSDKKLFRQLSRSDGSSSLDFERVVNDYSISVAKDRLFGRRAATATTTTTETTGLLSQQHNKKNNKNKKRRVDRELGRTDLAGWFLSCLTAVLIGYTAVFIVKTSEHVNYHRLIFLNKLEIVALEEGVTFYASYLQIFLYYASYNFVLAMVAGLLCLASPDAVGSGIPEIISYLNGVRITRPFCDLSLFLVKIVGTVTSVSAGLFIGPEGPLVHLGAIIGASVSETKFLEQGVFRFRTTFPTLSNVLGCAPLSERFRYDDNDNDGNDEHEHRQHCCKNSVVTRIADSLSQFRNDAERRDLVSIGAASGFAAAFGAPVGGLLFSLEEATTFFDHRMLFRTLVATALATFVISSDDQDITAYGIISLGGASYEQGHSDKNRCADIPTYAAIGVAGGLLGAAFNALWKRLNHARTRFYHATESSSDGGPHAVRWWKLLEVACVSILTSAVTFFLPLWADWACKDTDDEEKMHKFQFNCAEGQWNEMGSVLFGSREEAIKEILSDADSYDPRTLLIVGLLVLPFMLLTFGIPVPSGIFMPTILTGASLFGYVGYVVETYYPASSRVPINTFALLGAAAMLAGIQRSTVSLCVILMEGTGETEILIPVIVTVVMARFVGDLFNEGLYEIGIELKGFPYLEHRIKPEYDIYTVSDIMSGPPATICGNETAGYIERLLHRLPHNGFPVVEDLKSNKYLGLVRRDQLVALLECGVFMEAEKSVRPNMASMPLIRSLNVRDDRYAHHRNSSVSSSTATVVTQNFNATADVAYSGSKTVVRKQDGVLVVDLACEDRDARVDVAAVMNKGTGCVKATCPLSKAYRMFTTLGLRHLCVLGGESGGEVVGIITRENLVEEYVEEKTEGHAAGHHATNGAEC